MSWNINVNLISKDLFESALDGAEVIGDNAQTKQGQKQVALAIKTAKSLAKLIQRPNVQATLYGHAVTETDGKHWHEGITVSVTGVE